MGRIVRIVEFDTATIMLLLLTIILPSCPSSRSSCPSMSSVPVISSDSDTFLAALTWPGYGDTACEETDENHGPWFKDPCETVSEWSAGDSMPDFFEFLPGCTLQIKSMVVRPGCEVQMWYGFDYYGTNKTYQTGTYTNVGSVEDPNCNLMYGYA